MAQFRTMILEDKLTVLKILKGRRKRESTTSGHQCNDDSENIAATFLFYFSFVVEGIISARIVLTPVLRSAASGSMQVYPGTGKSA